MLKLGAPSKHPLFGSPRTHYCTHAHTHAQTNTHTHTHIRTHTHAHTHTCINKQTHTPARTRTRTHTHTHAQPHSAMCPTTCTVPDGVCQAVEGSRPVAFTIGLTAYVSLVQLVANGSSGSADTAMQRFVPPGQPGPGLHRPGYTWTPKSQRTTSEHDHPEGGMVLTISKTAVETGSQEVKRAS